MAANSKIHIEHKLYRARHGTDRQTDGQTDSSHQCIMRAPHGARGIINDLHVFLLCMSSVV